MKSLILFTLPILLLIAACRSAGSLETQTLDLPYPEADVITLSLDTTTGQVTVSAADTGGVQGSLTTNVGDWQATTTSSGSSITIQQGRASADVIPNAQNIWDLRLGREQALILNHTNTTADTALNLGGLAMTQVNVTGTAGNYTVSYDAPHPAQDGGTAAFQLINGNINAGGLLNSHLSSLAITTNGGNIQLGFDGEGLPQNMSVHLESQSGDVLLNIPSSVPTQIIYRTSSGSVLEVDPQYTEVNDITYSLGDYENSTAPRLTIEIRTVIGDLRLAGA